MRWNRYLNVKKIFNSSDVFLNSYMPRENKKWTISIRKIDKLILHLIKTNIIIAVLHISQKLCSQQYAKYFREKVKITHFLRKTQI